MPSTNAEYSGSWRAVAAVAWQGLSTWGTFGFNSTALDAQRRQRKTLIRIGHRFMTGQVCSTTGEYEFDGYADGSAGPFLSDEDKHIAMSAGKPFPTASTKTAYWKFLSWT